MMKYATESATYLYFPPDIGVDAMQMESFSASVPASACMVRHRSLALPLLAGWPGHAFTDHQSPLARPGL